MFLIALIGAVIGTTSCEHKPLYVFDNNPRLVRVIFNWDDLRENDPQPTGMHLSFTTESNGFYPGNEYDVPTATGLLTSITPQDYILTGYSNDIPNITATNISGDVEIHALDPDTDISPIYGFSQGELIKNEPREQGTTPTEQVIVAKPHPVNCIYTVMLLNTDREPDGENWGASLSGLTDAIMLSTGKSAANANEVTRNFTLDNVATPTMRYTTISVLGKLTDNLLRLRIKRANGSYGVYRTDVTKLIDKAPDFRNVTITVDLNACEIDPDGNGGGLQPDVDNFTEVDEEIVI